MTAEEAIAAAVKQMRDEVEMATMNLLGFGESTSTTSAEPPPPTLTMERMNAMLRDFRILAAQERRTRVTVIVSMSHAGEMLSHQTPSEGLVVECSIAQLLELHRRWPMKLSKILAVDQAEFVPVLPNFDRFPLALQLPPYELEEGDPDAV